MNIEAAMAYRRANIKTMTDAIDINSRVCTVGRLLALTTKSIVMTKIIDEVIISCVDWDDGATSSRELLTWSCGRRRRDLSRRHHFNIRCEGLKLEDDVPSACFVSIECCISSSRIVEFDAILDDTWLVDRDATNSFDVAKTTQDGVNLCQDCFLSRIASVRHRSDELSLIS